MNNRNSKCEVKSTDNKWRDIGEDRLLADSHTGFIVAF